MASKRDKLENELSYEEAMKLAKHIVRSNSLVSAGDIIHNLIVEDKKLTKRAIQIAWINHKRPSIKNDLFFEKTRVCSCCNEEKPVSGFYNNKRIRNGVPYTFLNRQCRQCFNKKLSQYFSNNPQAQKRRNKRFKEWYNKQMENIDFRKAQSKRIVEENKRMRKELSNCYLKQLIRRRKGYIQGSEHSTELLEKVKLEIFTQREMKKKVTHKIDQKLNRESAVEQGFYDGRFKQQVVPNKKKKEQKKRLTKKDLYEKE